MITAPARPPRLLVVDDDVVILRTIRRYLRDYEVTTAETGEEALAAAATCAPEVVLLDFNLPDLNGLEVMRMLRARGVKAPVLLMSGAFDSGVAAESLAYEADDYIAKPFLREALLRKLDRLLAEHQLAAKVARQHAELVELHERREYEATAARALLDQMVARGQFDQRVQQLVLSAEQFPGDVVCGAHAGEGRYRWMVADVTGHSLASALVTIPLASMFYAHARAHTPLPTLIETMDRELGELLPVTMFCTAIVCELDRRWGLLRVWNGGCPDVIVVSRPHVRYVTSSDPPLATRRGTTMRTHTIVELPVDPGDRVFAFSDGLLEARDPSGMMLGLPAIASAVADVPPESAFDHLRTVLEHHVGGKRFEDDVSVVAVQV